MNSTDEFVQVVEKPVGKLALRGDLHWLQLTSGQDLWYQGRGAYDNKIFGYQGRPANGHTSFASLVDISADWQTTKSIALNFYYAHVWGESVMENIYPDGHNAQFGYVEMVYVSTRHNASQRNSLCAVATLRRWSQWKIGCAVNWFRVVEHCTITSDRVIQ
jgi:hypothetical protein